MDGRHAVSHLRRRRLTPRSTAGVVTVVVAVGSAIGFTPVASADPDPQKEFEHAQKTCQKHGEQSKQCQRKRDRFCARYPDYEPADEFCGRDDDDGGSLPS